MSMGIDVRELRNCFGNFGTGVTIVTTNSDVGKPLGLTVNSFSSVSMDPPLILWSLQKTSSNLQAFHNADTFIVNILGATQMNLALIFACKEEERFSGIAHSKGIDGIPMLDGCIGYLQCRTITRYEAGDHIIFIGQVVEFSYKNAPGLLFKGGEFGVMTTYSTTAASPENKGGRENLDLNDFIVPLLAKAAKASAQEFDKRLSAFSVSGAGGWILGMLDVMGDQSKDQLMSYNVLDMATIVTALPSLEEGGFITHKEESVITSEGEDAKDIFYTIGDEGRKFLDHMKTYCDSFEASLFKGVPAENISAFKKDLRHIIHQCL